MGLVPHEKALVDRMKGRPFVLVGVNGDDDREKARVVSGKEEITWRSFWSGGGPFGPIPKKWGIRGWPTVYLIDAKGVIRNDLIDGLDDDSLLKAVEPLVVEAEKGTK